jgi:hypothetical protein
MFASITDRLRRGFPLVDRLVKEVGVTQQTAARLEELFGAERSVRKLHAELLRQDRAALVAAAREATRAALALADKPEANLRLVRVAELLAEVEGEESADLLIDILAGGEAEARMTAGEALEERGYSRFKELALAVERALERLPEGSPAHHELPYLLAELPEPGVLKLLARFLTLDDAEAVAAAIESVVEVGDPGASKHLAPLANDERVVDLADGTGAEAKVMIGELAKEAIDVLRRVGSDA